MISLEPEQRAQLVALIKQYFERELDQEIGQIDAERLLDFFSREIGNAHYNRGLRDARAVLDERLQSVADALYEIEQPVGFQSRA